jgi:hypothetical protein
MDVTKSSYTELLEDDDEWRAYCGGPPRDARVTGGGGDGTLMELNAGLPCCDVRIAAHCGSPAALLTYSVELWLLPYGALPGAACP